MKKRNLNSLTLNKKSVSHLQSNYKLFGGALAAVQSVGDLYTKCPLKACIEKTMKKEG
ncbi:MAG: hypothetical protein AAF617_17055 [Bacteroidota bacterium]